MSGRNSICNKCSNKKGIFCLVRPLRPEPLPEYWVRACAYYKAQKA